MGRFSFIRASHLHFSTIATAVAMLLIPLWVGAVPLTFLVGRDSSCDFATIQGAVDAAQLNPGPDVIHVTIHGSGYARQAIKVGAQELEIIGGFATCASVDTLGRTTISGQSNGAKSVIQFRGAGNRVLRNLFITRGSTSFYGGVGGGIDFDGSGELVLNNVGVGNNDAYYGGGINFRGAGGFSALVLEHEVVISDNYVFESGGGVRVEGDARLIMIGDQTTITRNEARGFSGGGYGGGVQIIPPAHAEIASPGYGNQGAITDNRAKRGGGIAVSGSESGTTDGFALLYTTDPQRPVTVSGNVASVAGGGVYLNNDNNNLDLCAYEFRLDDNRAPDGAALFAAEHKTLMNSTKRVVMNRTTDRCGLDNAPILGAVACAPGVPCNRIRGNIVQTVEGQPAVGSTIVFQGGDWLVDRVALLDNTATDLIYSSDQQGDFDLLNDCLIGGNTLTRRIMTTASGNGARIAIGGCTIANNNLGASNVFSAANTFELRNSILWQPGKTSLSQSGGGRTIENVITSESLSLGGGNGFTVIEADPRLVDPGAGDYHLRAGSPAIDFAPAIAGDDRDLDGRPRDQDLPIHFNRTGVRDIGAYERQALLPLVLNGTFDANDRLWNVGIPGISARDPAQNISGAPGSGSMAVDFVNPPGYFVRRINVRQQCIHLPGPGTYYLNGYGHTVPASAVQSQSAILYWQFSSNGNEACSNINDVDQFGEFVVGNGPAWGHPANPTSIVVTESMWTSNSSISVAMLVELSGILLPTTHLKAWFDGITLDVGPVSDGLFAEGFVE